MCGELVMILFHSHLKDPTIAVEFHQALCLTSKKLTEIILVSVLVLGGGGERWGGSRVCEFIVIEFLCFDYFREISHARHVTTQPYKSLVTACTFQLSVINLHHNL